MKLLLSLLSLSLAGFCSAQCTIVPDPNPPQYLICGQTGHIKGGSRRISTFTAPNREFCTNLCVRNGYCEAISYDKRDGTCNVYLDRIREGGFQKDDESPLAFYNTACNRLKGECHAPSNPSFEGPTAKAILPPKRFLPFGRIVQVAPWDVETLQSNDYPGNFTTAYLAKPGDRPAGSRPSPSGGNFAVFSLGGGQQADFRQRFNLKGNTEYIMSFQYSFISYKGPKNDTSLKYDMYGACRDGGQYSDTQAPVSFNISDPGAANGEWRTFSMTLTTSPKESPLGQFCGPFLVSPGRLGGNRAVFGFDRFSLQPARTA